MKKTNLLLALLLLLTLALSGCGGSSATSEAASVEVSGTPMPGQGLSDSMRLLLGILSLADSETPLTAEQANAMLPLWKAVRSLGESDTAAQTEIDALYTQIRSILTDEQLTAIDNMALSMESMASLAEELGLEMQFVGGRGSNASPEMQATMQALRESGQMPQFEEGVAPPEGMILQEGGGVLEIRPGGDMPSGGVVIEGGPGTGGGRMFGDASGLTPEQMATAQASGANLPALNNTINSVWLDALISMLEGIAAGE
jgi:hypothetical protein